jgi:predicted dehydrogenase
MPLNLTPEQKETGKANFQRVAAGLTRRDFMKSMAVTGAIVAPVSAAAYFQYAQDRLPKGPVKTALIGGGDEGGVLVGEHNPKYLEIVAVADIRPSNKKRIFEGDKDWKTRNSPRKGLNYHYGTDADKKIKVYDDYREVLARKDVEAVIIALPLFLHAPVAIEALNHGKHVLCEKLMAWNVQQCKDMIKAAEANDRILSIGHQRHYSLLYAHALEIVQSGVLGDAWHIRALWHRNRRPKLDSAGKAIPGQYHEVWGPDIPDEDRRALESRIRGLGYKSMDELVRWRVYNRTGGGLMAELGSHQLDACSIFLGKVHPLAVSGVGGKYFYKDWEVDDHVFVTFEFPGQKYFADAERKQVQDPNDRVIVTYSSISTNAFEPYGECIMGHKGTLVVETEQNVLLYPDGGRNVSVAVTTAAGGKPALDSSATTGGAAPAAAAAAGVTGAVSRGYREEMEHFTYCIRMWDQGLSKSDRPQVRCHGKAAMADAIIALTSNLAMKSHQRTEFKEEWFDPTSAEVPDQDMKAEIITA